MRCVVFIEPVMMHLIMFIEARSASSPLPSPPPLSLFNQADLKAISNLRIFLRMHELDPRYQTIRAQQRLSGLYFSYILILVEDPSVIKGMQQGEKEQWLACFVFLLRNTSTTVLRNWMRSETKVLFLPQSFIVLSFSHFSETLE